MSGIGFATGNTAAGIVLLLATVSGAALGGAEWRRPDRRWRGARVGAVLAAVGALTLLALRPTMRRSGEPPRAGAGSGAEVALWTGGPRPADEAEILRPVPADLRFRLSGAEAPGGTPTVPDAASLRRHVPPAGTLHLCGDGLDADDLAALAPGRVVFHPGADGTVPRIAFVHSPRVLGPGEPLRVTGEVRGGRPGEALTVAWEGPDTAAVTAPVAADGTFQLRAPGLPTAGRYGWKLRLVGAGERVLEEGPGGVSVVAPDLPRVLVLEGSPHPDTAALRGWLGAAGGVVNTRTEVGRGRFRFAATGGGPGEFAGVNDELLGHFDLLLTDTQTLAAIADPERGTLRRAVVERGLGVLVRGGEPPPPPGPRPDGPAEVAFFLPGRLEPAGQEAAPGTAGADRLTRLRWTGRHGEETIPDEPVPVLPFRFSEGEGEDGSVVLVRDGQGRAVAARVTRGRGRVAVSLAADTARWRRVGHPGAFAAFWSDLLGDLAAPRLVGTEGRWTLAGAAASGPAWVDGPVSLRWQGPGGVVAPPGTVTAEDAPEGTPPVTLTLAPDPAEPTRGTARFWPRHAGWHRVRTAPGGPAEDFYVAPAGSWPGVRAAGRRRETARFVALGKHSGAPPARPRPESPAPTRESGVAAGVLLLGFVAAAGFLWAEGRREG